MIAIHFTEEYAKEVKDAINGGKPLSPPPDPVSGVRAWTGNNMLTLMGMLYATVFSQGPHSYQLPDSPDIKKLHPERREAVDETFSEDVLDATEFLGMLTFKVWDGEYDRVCEPIVSAVVLRRNGQRTVIQHTGFKK